MRFSFISLLTFALVFAAAAAAHAETRYISDQLVVTVRSNKTDKYQVLETLLTGAPVEILDEDKSFVKVRTKKGTEGFIRKQYVTKQTPKSILLARLNKQKAVLEDQLLQQKEKYQETSGLASSSQAEIDELTKALEQTRVQLKKVSGDYDLLMKRSENVLNLTNERDQLLEENNRIVSELQVLQEENKDFHRSNMIQWFLAGGGVFLGGWLAGKASRKKRGFSRF